MQRHNSWSPERVNSKECKFGCGRMLFFSVENHWWSNSPNGDDKHTEIECKTIRQERKTENIPVNGDVNNNLLHLISLVNEVRLKLDAVLDSKNV